MSLPPTPTQTVGPYLALGLPWPDGPDVVPDGTPGAVLIGGTVFDGAGALVPDALVETWQADPDGRFDHPDDPRGAAKPSVEGFRGFGRCPTDDEGRWWIRTVLPGVLPAEAPQGADARSAEAPHVNVSVFARGLLDRVVTRVYFPEHAAAHATEPLLTAVPADRRHTLVAVADGPGRYRFDIRLRGEGETVFLAL
ncbi:protocatechuate 3,4-dioxygenase subunit alpha [Pseudonocardia sp. HH130629-09]|uniref:protocatechuate 3,4-dioxygenase subunit alpha n=1 Tax=Pseudonocardia sp. HH130629-09 TaxID=1641402 RepID=UPI0006CB43EB|nr:protocatechuate 3,4-dioxygenase subunit alpha [Pseudonocardia sp. HH130629-09]ALE82366.1 protocatechuate 3,4-dioxygenase [Pseudonocardia sp. HH130629-09]